MAQSSAGTIIPETTFKDVTIIFCVIAIVGAMARTAIRFHKGHQRIVDESLLFFACSCLMAATALLHKAAPPLYQVIIAEAAEKADPGFTQEIPMKSVVEEISKIQTYTYPFGALIWAVVFAVKFCYLRFFRLLVDRQQPLVNYWKIAMIITLIAAVFNICASFESCPKFGKLDLKCQEPYYVKRTLAVEVTTIAFDIITDLMSTFISLALVGKLTSLVLTIPPWLLWNVKIRLRQRIGIGSTLSLSLIMVVIAVIRITRVHASDFEIWAPFWQQIEASIAVLMLSLTAFRTLFVSAKSPQRQQKNKANYSLGKRLWPSSKKLQDERYIELNAPGASLTGLPTIAVKKKSVSWPTAVGGIQDVDATSDDLSAAFESLTERTH